MSMLKSVLLPAAILLALGLGGCGTSYRTEFERLASEKHWTAEQTKNAYYYSLRLGFLKKAEDGTYAVVYSVLPKDDVVRQLEQNLADLEDILDYKNPGWNSYMKTFGMRPYFLRQEFILKAVLARLLADENDKKFKEFLGESSGHGDLAGQNVLRGYDEKVFAIVNLSKAFPFQSKVLEEARSAGLVKEVARTVKTDSRDLYQKEPDPADPTDKYKFVWVSKKLAFERVEYKVMVPDEVPQNSKPNYVEIWRMVDGKRESLPAVKAFLDGYGNAILVLDTDKEGDMIGFGLPNSVTRVAEDEVFSDRMIDRIFPDAKKDKRVEPKVPPIRVEIVRAGSPIDPWQVCPEADGCRTPGAYRRLPMKDNYNVRVQLKVEKKKGETEKSVTIESVTKEWTDGKSEYAWSSGKVVEYYKPKAYCQGSSLLSAQVLNVENKKKIRIACKDGTEADRVVTPSANVVIEEKPFQVAFSIGETRWLVWDSDGDGKFDKRRKISSVLRYDIGIYPLLSGLESGTNPQNEEEAPLPEQVGGPGMPNR